MNRLKSAWLQEIERKKRKAWQEEERVAKEKADAKKKKKKKQGATAAKTQGGQLAVAALGSSTLPKHPAANTPGTVTPNTKWVRKLI